MPETYEGWSNRETWLIALYLGNDHDLYKLQMIWTRRAVSGAGKLPQVKAGIWTPAEGTRFSLAATIKAHFENRAQKFTFPTVWADDLFSAALGRVSWQEIADNLLEEV